jgi:ABC-2 type transport system permease protein
MKGVQDAIIATHQDLKDTFNLPTEAEPVVFDAYLEYGDVADIEFIDYFAPAIICFAIMMVTIMLTIILFVFERRNGTLQRLLASPASETEIVFGYALAFAVIGLCQSIIILVAAILIFDIAIVGGVVLALVVVMLLAIGHQGLGILLSSAAKNELQAIQFIPLIIFPSVLLTGLFWPIESIPPYLQPLSYIIPLRYGIDAERSIMLRGWGIEGVWLEILILIAFAVSMLAFAILMLKRRKE